MKFQAGYHIRMLKPTHTATKDWREAREERRRGGKEERRRGGEKEERRGDLLLLKLVLRALTNVLLLFTRVFKWYPLKTLAFSRRLCHSDVKTHAHSNKKITESAKSS